MISIDSINWIQALLGFLSGGACGALIKQYYDNRRNKVQPIARTVEIKSFFDAQENRLLNSQLTFKESSQVYTFSNLYSGTIEIINSGQHDYTEFSFGITCPNNVKLIHIKSISSDRHHIVEFETLPSLENQINTFDVNLKPFNRKDSYIFDILATTTEGQFSAMDVEISSSMPIKWVDPKVTQKLISEIVREAILPYPFNLISIKKFLP